MEKKQAQMTLPVTPEQTIITRRDWRMELERLYQPTSQRLQASYARVADRLRPEFDALSQTMIDRYASTGELTAADVRGMPQYARLLTRVEAELNDFGIIARNEIEQATQLTLPFGGDWAYGLTLESAGAMSAAVRSAWIRPNPEALARLVGYTDSPAFQAKWAAFGETAAQQLGDLYLVGLAQGKNPRFVARMASNWLSIPYAWTENSARTTMIWSARTANHISMAANETILDGWTWGSAQDVRTCPSCWDRDGEFHPLSDVLNDHHRGRCAPIPHIRGMDRIERLPGNEVFETLPVATQRDIMGKGLWEAWRNGDVRWGELSEPYQDAVFGEMLRARTLKSFGIKAA